MDQNNDNTHRSLPNLIGVNAWFAQDPENERRFTLHANVSFGEERLGGGADSEVTFRLSVKRCDIVFIPPAGSPFKVDPSSVRMPKPLNPKAVSMRNSSATTAGGKVKLNVSATGLGSGVEAGHHFEKSKEASSDQLVSMYNEIWRRVRSHHAWCVDGSELERGRLFGPVFDAHNEPRLTIVDKRSDDQIARDAKNKTQPVASIQVSCLREDIDIYEIEFKELGKQGWFTKKPTSEAQEMVAREVLKEALLREGLLSGDLAKDPFSEMTICDVAISIIE